MQQIPPLDSDSRADELVLVALRQLGLGAVVMTAWPPEFFFFD
jgi:hypothetical protein